MQSTPNGAEVTLTAPGTDPTDPLEQLRARLVLSIGQREALIGHTRTTLVEHIARNAGGSFANDLGVLTRRISDAVAERRVLRDLLADVDELSGRERSL